MKSRFSFVNSNPETKYPIRHCHIIAVVLNRSTLHWSCLTKEQCSHLTRTPSNLCIHIAHEQQHIIVSLKNYTFFGAVLRVWKFTSRINILFCATVCEQQHIIRHKWNFHRVFSFRSHFYVSIWLYSFSLLSFSIHSF